MLLSRLVKGEAVLDCDTYGSDMGKVAFLRPIEGRQEERSDNDLLAACGRSDSAALGILFDRHHVAVHRFISRLAGADPDDVDDLLQDTFIQVGKSAGRFSGKAPARNWIFGVAVNVVRRHVRKGAQHRRMIGAIKDLSAPCQGSALNDVQTRQELKMLMTAVAALPYKLKIPFVMCEIEGISGVEAAVILGLRKGTLWRRLHEARKALIAAMGRRGS